MPIYLSTYRVCLYPKYIDTYGIVHRTSIEGVNKLNIISYKYSSVSNIGKIILEDD